MNMTSSSEEKSIQKVFGENLRRLREENQLSRAEMAKVFYYTEDAIAKWEQGSRIPKIETLLDIASYFGVSLDDLFSESTKKPDEHKYYHFICSDSHLRNRSFREEFRKAVLLLAGALIIVSLSFYVIDLLNVLSHKDSSGTACVVIYTDTDIPISSKDLLNIGESFIFLAKSAEESDFVYTEKVQNEETATLRLNDYLMKQGVH